MKYIDYNDPNLMDKALRAYDYYSGRLRDQKEDRFNETEEFLRLVKIGEEIKLKQNSFTYKGTYTEEEAEECAKAFWQQKFVLDNGIEYLIEPDKALSMLHNPTHRINSDVDAYHSYKKFKLFPKVSE
jgi:hypothetical protein